MLPAPIDSISFPLLLLLLFLLLLPLHLLLRPSLPPGLPRLPLLGSVPWILWSGKHVMEIVKNDRRKHGPLSSVGFGPINLIFINDPSLIREVLMREDMAGRPSSSLGLQMKSWGRKIGLIAPDGNCPVWRDHRRFVLRGLREQGFGSRSEQSVLEEATALVEHLLATSGESVVIKEQFNIPVVNVIWKMVANRTFSLGSSEGHRFMTLMDELFTKSFPALALVPILGRLLIGKQIKRRFAMFAEMRELFLEVIEEHEQSLDESEPRDLIDKYLVELRSGRPGFEKQQLVIILLDLFAAGSETTATTLRWAVLYLVLHPEVQAKCHRELEQLGSASVSLKDMDRLPYCQATVLEVLRLSCTAPGTLMHKALVPLQLAGFSLPAGSAMSGNFMATHSDPDLWEAPELFLPDRFLEKANCQDCPKPRLTECLDCPKPRLRDTPHFFPFSLGRRVCMGESLARVELFLFLTTLVQKCKFLTVPGQPLPSTSNCRVGITRIPDPFSCRIVDRITAMENQLISSDNT